MSEEREGQDEELVPLVEVYRCGTEMEVNRVIDELLEPAGLEAFLRDRTSHSIPSPGEMGAYFIAVAEADADKARKVLQQARDKGQIDSEDGELIGA